MESPCFATVSPPLSYGISVRIYDAAVDNGATLVSSNVTAALQPWQDGLEVSVNHLFEYLTDNGNADDADLTAYLTAPLMFRPARSEIFSDSVIRPSCCRPPSCLSPLQILRSRCMGDGVRHVQGRKRSSGRQGDVGQGGRAAK